MSAKLTRHFEERANERLSLSKTSMERIAPKVFEEGLRPHDAKGHLRGYMVKLLLRDPNHGVPILYGENIYITKGETILTVWQLPTNLKTLAAAILRKRNKKTE